MYLKGVSPLHDTALAHHQAEGSLPQLAPRWPSLAEQLIHLLQQVMLFAQESSAIQASQGRPGGRPPELPLQHLYLALLRGMVRPTSHLSTIWRRLSLEEIGTFAPVRLT